MKWKGNGCEEGHKNGGEKGEGNGEEKDGENEDEQAWKREVEGGSSARYVFHNGLYGLV